MPYTKTPPTTPLGGPSSNLGGPRGPSGKIVVVFSSGEKKRELYARLIAEGYTMKGWIAKNALEQFGITME